jgi:hypothetical protein
MKYLIRNSKIINRKTEKCKMLITNILQNKQQQLICIFLCLILVLGCNNNEEGKPSNLISEKQMAAIITDIHVVEARVNKMALPNLDTSTLVSERLKAQLFKQYKIDTATFNANYKYYSTRPDYLERIYEDVTKQLQKREKKKDYRRL